MRFVKGMLYAFTALLIVLAVTVAYVTQVLDPNDLKPTLVKAANNQQISLTIEGPISWTFYPWLGVAAEDVVAESPQGRLQADRLEGSVSLLSLLADTIIIDRLTAIRPQVELTNQGTQDNQSTATTESQFIQPLVIRELAISEGTILGLQPGLSLDQVNLQLDSLTPGAESAMSFDGQISYRNTQFPLKFTATITPSATFDSVTIRNPELVSRDAKIALDGYASAALGGNFAAEGRLVVKEFSLRNWLRAANLEAPASRDLTTLSAVSLESEVKLSNQLLSLKPLTARVDSSQLTASIDLNLDPLSLNLDATLDQLDLDAYLTQGEPTEVTPSSSQFALLPGAYRLNVESLKVAEISLSALAIELGVQADEISLGRFDVGVFGGTIRSTGSHLIAPQVTNLNGTIEGIQLATLPKSGALQSLSGEVTGAFDVRAAGHQIDNAKASLTGPVRLRIADASLGALNVSEAMCQALGQQSVNTETSRDTLSLRAMFREGLADIESLEAQVANIALSATGRFSLVSTALNLNGEAGIPADGNLGLCMAPESVRGFLVPLTCQGRIADNALNCGIDRQRLSGLIGQAAEQRLKDKAREAVEKQLNQKLEGQAQDLLKNLLGR